MCRRFLVPIYQADMWISQLAPLEVTCQISLLFQVRKMGGEDLELILPGNRTVTPDRQIRISAYLQHKTVPQVRQHSVPAFLDSALAITEATLAFFWATSKP